MPSYVITGVSKSWGFEFLRQLSQDPTNLVIGIVRDKASTDNRVAVELSGRPNIHILQADITDFNALQKAAIDAAKITDGSLDYLVANAGYVSHWDAYDPIGVLGEKPQELEEDLMKCLKINVVGNIHLFNLFMPLILKGNAKKVVALSSGHADLDSINAFDNEVAALYSISKAAINVAVAKFSAQYKKQGVLFISISPGMVEVGHFKDATPAQMQSLGGMLQKFQQYNPEFSGPMSPDASVRAVISVREKASVQNGDGGSFVSHHGNKTWT
ncbi:NAD(P)-binding protein [Xylaria grammica]|nr:NAD(P)-binding protein [Xylaria grammica]